MTVAWTHDLVWCFLWMS